MQLPKILAAGQDCALCGAASGRERVCEPCRRTLPWIGCACSRCALPLPAPGACGECLRSPPPFESAIAAFEYRFPIDRVIHRYKFGGDLALGRWLAEGLVARLAAACRPDVLVVPAIGRARLRHRGFDQALEVARHVGRAIDVEVEAGAIARVRDTGTQRGLGARARRANLQGAFECRRSMAGRRVAVVDDVITTGATARAVAHALVSAGAARVAIWAVARTA